MAEVEFHLHNEVGIRFPPLRPAYSDGELYFERFRCLIARSTGTSIIGEGGTGRIHLVRDELMEREVALKIPLESILRDPAARDDIIQETRLAMDLTHPNIVRIHDFHEGGGRWGLSMQYVRGKNLDEWRYDVESTGFRRAIKPYTVEAISDWIAQLCDALRYAHEDARMVHRDIKPKNLMLEKRDGGEKVYITDFGISQRLRQHTMMLSRVQSKAGESKGNMGTLPYMPWEQISGAPASPLDDIYAVGATIFELITGRPPFYDGGFEQIKVQIRETIPPSMEKRILDLGLHMSPPPDVWEQVVEACLAKRAEDRPQSMRAVAAALGFQAGSNTELEAKVVIQSERIDELENQIIRLSTSTAVVDPAAGAQLQEARQQLAALQQEASQAQDDLRSREELLQAARAKEAEVVALLQATTAERDAALQGGEAALRKIQEDSAERSALAEENLGRLQQELEAARTAGEALVQQAQLAARQQVAELEAKLQAARTKEAEVAARLQATAAERDAALQGGDAALRKFQQDSAKRIALAEDKSGKLQQELEAARTSGEALVKQAQQAQQAARQQVAELDARLQAARSKEAEVAARLQATAAERDAALQGGDAALRRVQEDSAKRIALAEGKSGKLQQELEAARTAGDAQVKQAQQAAQQKIAEVDARLQAARKDADMAVQASKREAEQAVQATRKEAAQALLAATEKMRREAEQLSERLRKTEESKDKAVSLAREEGEKRLHKQTEELEKTRHSLTKVAQQNEQLKSAVAIEKERQGASLRPLLVGLFIAMVLGLGGGLATSMLKNSAAAAGLSEAQNKYLPAADQVADSPVPFELFECFAKEIGTTVKQLRGTKGKDDGKVYGINGITALNFCNWLTKKAPPKSGYRYTLPDSAELKEKVVKGKMEWSKSWADKDDKDKGSDLVWNMRGYGVDGTEDNFPVHVIHEDKNFTFRIKLEKIPDSIPDKPNPPVPPPN
ncbi:MAG: protein kinase [Verrucomicrobia bacterium]|nr:protein kinase [Verrucomicrobiota bacterium]